MILSDNNLINSNKSTSMVLLLPAPRNARTWIHYTCLGKENLIMLVITNEMVPIFIKKKSSNNYIANK